MSGQVAQQQNILKVLLFFKCLYKHFIDITAYFAVCPVMQVGNIVTLATSVFLAVLMLCYILVCFCTSDFCMFNTKATCHSVVINYFDLMQSWNL